MADKAEKIIHPIPPYFDKNSKILILGSFPSVKSREQGFFYGHPQNRFWKVLASLSNKKIPETIDEKKALLKALNIALWDVLESCEIRGSADSSIKNAKVNDLSVILKKADIHMIFTNGKTAEKYYNKYLKNLYPQGTLCLPSTSPANAAKTLDMLIEEWKIILKY